MVQPHLGIAMKNIEEMNAKELDALIRAANIKRNKVRQAEGKDFLKTDEYKAFKAKKDEIVKQLKAIWAKQKIKLEITLTSEITDEQVEEAYRYSDNSVWPTISAELSKNKMFSDKEHKIMQDYIDNAVENACEDLEYILNKDSKTTKALNKELKKIHDRFRELGVSFKDA